MIKTFRDLRQLPRFMWVLGFATLVVVSGTTPSRSAGAETVVNVLDLKTLSALEDSGYSLSEMLGGTKLEASTHVGTATTKALYDGNPLYKNFADTVGKDLPHDPKTDQWPDVIPEGQGDVPEMVRLLRNFEDKGKRSDNDGQGGFYIRHLSNNSQYPYLVEYDGDEPRYFDTRWLNSPIAAFKLIAVVNRIDRLDFAPDSCGEVRFIYRLSYRSAKSSSSLPFFLNVVYVYPKEKNCGVYAKKWIFDAPSAISAAGLKGGPLQDLHFKQLEFNFQSLRFTSGYMHDFGGQAMYMLRIFRLIDGELQPVALENTPDVLAIEKDPSLLKKFVEFLKSGKHLAELDEGTLNINFDDRFLAKFALSWSTLGRARTADKPYRRLFQGNKKLLNTVDISGLHFIKSRDGLVERLDNLTCMGCHQSGGTAGFHILGISDPAFSHGFNRQELPLSPHAYAESFRRRAYIENLAKDLAPDRFRPHSNFSRADWSKARPKYAPLAVGQLCLGGKNIFSAGPACAAGSECRTTVANRDTGSLFGECVSASDGGGQVCWMGDVKEHSSLPRDRGPIAAYNEFAFQDKFVIKEPIIPNRGSDVGPYKCVAPQSGAPLGRSSRACTVAEENFTDFKIDPVAREVCANQGGTGFDMCAATGDSGACLQSFVARAMLDTCYPGKFCREDYICQKFPDYDKIPAKDYLRKKDHKPVNVSSPEKIRGDLIEAAREKQIGFCVPTYFLFNMRVDGHPSPVTGLAPGEPKVDRRQPVRGYFAKDDKRKTE